MNTTKMAVELIDPRRGLDAPDIGTRAVGGAPIRVDGLSKAYTVRSGDVAALEDISLEIAGGEIHRLNRSASRASDQ